MNRKDKRKTTQLFKKQYKHVYWLEDYFLNLLFNDEINLSYSQLYFTYSQAWIEASKKYNDHLRKSSEPRIDENYFTTQYKPQENETI
jgi:hypothetical protein